MRITSSIALVASLLVQSAHAATIAMNLVHVGNPGNAADYRGYGSVGYGYSISKYEVTAGQYAIFLNSVAKSDPHGLYNPKMWSDDYGCRIERLSSDGGYTYRVATDRANRPVNYVSFFDAMRFTNWLHNGQGSGDTETGAYTVGNGTNEVRSSNARYWIPSENEWYKAAYHKNDGPSGNYFSYPTSSDSEPNNDLISPDPGNHANFYQSGYTIGSPYWTTEVGEFENSASPYGTFDQGGNVFEWNETLINTSLRGLRDGSFGGLGYLYAGTRIVNRDLTPAFESGGSGFRVAARIPEPGSLALGSAGALTLIIRRRGECQRVARSVLRLTLPRCVPLNSGCSSTSCYS